MHISYKGMPNSLVVTGGLENANEGFSAGMQFKTVHDPASTSPVKVSSQVLAGVGMMVGEPDPMMMFPAGTRFTPYAAFRNVTAHALSITPSVNYMDSSVAKTLPLPVVELAPFESRQIDLPSALVSLGMAKFNGSINISLAYTGGTNDLLAALGSVDQKGTYVFEVEARRVAPGVAKSVNYWNLNNGNDTMFTLWNPGEQDEKLLVTLYFMGGHYKIPVQLAAQASTMFNVSDIVMERQPDPDGNRIPTFIRQGSAVISGPDDEPDTINVVVEAGIFNAKTKTCAGTCQTCYGYTDYWADPDPLFLPAGGSSQMAAIAQYMNGTQYDKTFLSSWSSDGPAATVSSSGMVNGVSGGSVIITTTFLANIPGTACSGLDDINGDPTECPIQEVMEADPPVTVATFTGVLTANDNFAGRSTTNFGIAEVINLSFSTNPSGATAASFGGLQWTIVSGGGTITSGTDGTGTYTAPSVPATVVLRLAVASGSSVGNGSNYQIAIVSPSGAHMAKDSNLRHTTGFAGVGFKGDIFLEPANVSFAGMFFSEGSTFAVASGFYAQFNNLQHPDGVLASVGSCNLTSGCIVIGQDRVDTGDLGPPFSVGDFLWQIPWQYSVGTGRMTQFMLANQHHFADATGKASAEKAGSGAFSKNAGDPTSSF